MAGACPAPTGTPATIARLGEPLCPDCYDYTGSVLFNACAPELWRRFTITLRRTLARQAGLTNKALAAQLRVSFAKVAEYQRRGVVHFHAIIRLDGPTGPDTAPPAWATVDLLTAAIAQAADTVHLDTPAAPGLPARTLCLGTRARHPADHHHRGTHRYQGRGLRRQVRHQGRRVHRHPRPPHHPSRPARRAARQRARPPPHRHLLAPGQTPRTGRSSAGRLGAHARLPRPLLHQEPPLLHHLRRAARRTRPAPARPRPHRKPLART